MQEKLSKVRPLTIAQASRIPGVTPAAVSLVNVYIEIQGGGESKLRLFSHGFTRINPFCHFDRREKSAFACS